MLDYTRGVIGDTIDSLKKLARSIDLMAQSIYITYLTISTFTGRGFLVTNILLLLISIAYLIYFLASEKTWYTKEERVKRKKIKNLVWYAKKLVHLAVIVLAIVDLYLSESIDAFSILSLIFMVLGFLIPSLLKVIINIFEKRKDLFMAALKKDLAAPVDGIKSIARKLSRTPAQEETDAVQIKLGEIRAEQKEIRKKKKAWKKSLDADKLQKTK